MGFGWWWWSISCNNGYRQLLRVLKAAEAVCLGDTRGLPILAVFAEFCCESKDTLKHLLIKKQWEKNRLWSETFLDKCISQKDLPNSETELSLKQNNLMHIQYKEKGKWLYFIISSSNKGNVSQILPTVWSISQKLNRRKPPRHQQGQQVKLCLLQRTLIHCW